MDPFVRLTHHPFALAPGTRLLKQSDYQTLVMAERMIDAAQQQADERRNQAEQEQARRYQAGYEQGLAQARLEMAAKMLETVDRTVDYLGDIEHKIVDLVMVSVRKILGEFEDTELTRRVARQALQVVRNQPQAMIRVCPAQADLLQQRLHDLLTNYHSTRTLDILPDPRLMPGDCVLETEIGVVDASLETQLAALEGALRSRLTQRTDAQSTDR